MSSRSSGSARRTDAIPRRAWAAGDRRGDELVIGQLLGNRGASRLPATSGRRGLGYGPAVPGTHSGKPIGLSIIVPVFNESATLERVLRAVDARDEVSQIVIVDDGSRDGSPEIVRTFPFRHPYVLVVHPANRGKGAAVRSGLEHANGDVVLVQDADLEYDPADYPGLLEPFADPDVMVVFGSRTFSSQTAYSFWFVVGNRLVTLVTNMLYNTWISDMETCFKAMRREVEGLPD